MFRAKGVDLYCSILTQKDLLSKKGLKDSERKKIMKLLASMKVLRIDNDINKKFFSLMEAYGENSDFISDYIIAATASKLTPWPPKLLSVGGTSIHRLNGLPNQIS